MATTHAQSRTVFAVPIAVGFFFMAMMLPTAVSLNLGGLRLSAYRIVLIVMIVPMMVQLLSGQRGRINLFDMLLFAHCSWALLALINSLELHESIIVLSVPASIHLPQLTVWSLLVSHSSKNSLNKKN